MKTPPFRKLLSVAVLCCVSSSCVTYTKYKDEIRTKVRFSSASTAQIFYDAYASVDSPVGNGSVEVLLTPPLRSPFWYRTQDTENTRFNAAIRAADANHDNIITDKEARNYAAAVEADRKRKKIP